MFCCKKKIGFYKSIGNIKHIKALYKCSLSYIYIYTHDKEIQMIHILLYSMSSTIIRSYKTTIFIGQNNCNFIVKYTYIYS